MGKIQPQRSVTMMEERGEMVARRRSVDAGEMVERYPAVIPTVGTYARNG